MEDFTNVKRTKEVKCIIDCEEGVNETEIFATDNFSVLPIDYFGEKVYRLRRIIREKPSKEE